MSLSRGVGAVGDRPSALVLGTSRSRGVLTATRALGRAGWRVGIGTPRRRAMVTASRWCDRAHPVARPRGDGEAFRTSVAEAVRDGGYDLVFAGADDWLVALVTWRDEVPTVVAHPPAPVVRAALDKLELARRARSAGLSVPRTLPATTDAIAGWDGPVVVKCRTHWRPGADHAHRIDARWFESVAVAADRLAAIRCAGLDPILQTPVNGVLGAVVGLFVDGRLRGVVQQQADGVWPTPSGSSSRARTVPVDGGLVTRCERLLRDLGWDGLVELQFLTPPGGRPRLVDLNGRYYGSMALAVAAGSNLPDAWARHALGEAVPELEPGRVGVRYHWTAGDLRRAVAERRGGLVSDLADSLRWAVQRDTASVWDLRDPAPALHVVGARFRGGGLDRG